MGTMDMEERLTVFFESALVSDIIRVGEHRHYHNNDELMDIGSPITHFPIVLEGSLKVITEDEKGNELLLYYLEMGDTCAMTLQCCLNQSRSTVRVLAEGSVDLLLIPIGRMEEWIVQYSSWRRFIFNSYNERLQEMLQAIDKLAFENLEARLYSYLRDKAMVTGSPLLKTTHSQIANELNTSRVVISRLMKKLEQQQKISSERNQIHLKEFA